MSFKSVIRISNDSYWYQWSLESQYILNSYKKESDVFQGGQSECFFRWTPDKCKLKLNITDCCLNADLLSEVTACIIDSQNTKKFKRKKNKLIQEKNVTTLSFLFEEDHIKLEQRKDKKIRFQCYIPDPEDELSFPSLDLTNILKNGEFSDVTIMTKDDKGEPHQFTAHCNILSSRSPVFEKMLKIDMKEKAERKIIIKEFDTSIVQEVLNYIYSGTINVQIILQKLEDMLIAADYYDLDQMKQMIGEVMKKNIRDDNVFQYLLLADHYSISRLKKKTIRHIINMKNFSKTKGFRNIPDSHGHLFKDILTSYEDSM